MYFFENSLRRDTSSPIPKKHSSCKGAAHGTGNYGLVEEKEEVDKCPFQRNNSKRWSGRSDKSFRKISDSCIETESLKAPEVNKNTFQRNGSARWSFKSNSKKPEKKPTSVSSENFSESDSLDSLGDKTKCSDSIEDTNKKESVVSNRLYNGVTRSSIAKTAKMRHLDIFDVDDSVWIGGLRKNNAPDEADKKLKQKLLNEIENTFDRSRSGSLRRRSSNPTSENPGDKHGKDTSKENLSVKPKGIPPKVPPRNNLRRQSFKFKNGKRPKQYSYEEIFFMSYNKKTAGFFNVVASNDCFKDFNEILSRKNIQVGNSLF